VKVYRDLEIYGTSEALGATLEEINRVIAPPWSIMANDDEDVLPGPSLHGYARDRTSPHPPVTLWLAEDLGRLYVSNIIPGRGRLSADEYNAIAQEFYERFVEPTAEKTGVRSRLSDPEVGEPGDSAASASFLGCGE
jgi:hypothetical protein